MNTAGHPISDDDLHAFVDNQLDPRRRREVARLLDDDPAAADRVAAFSAQRADLRAALAGFAEAPMPDAVRLDTLLDQRNQRRWAVWRMAAAVVLALGLGGSGGWLLRAHRPSAQNDVAELVREAVANHTVYTADLGRPTELGADQREDLSRWVSDRLKLSVTPPDLSAAGFRFMGGRLAATAEGPAGMFMYHDGRGVWLTLFVRPFPDAPSAPMTNVASRGLAGCAWIQKGVGYMVVGGLPPNEVRRLAGQVQRQMAAAI